MSGLTTEVAEQLVDIMADLGVEAQVYDGYSGRGMYGSTVVAITSSDQGAVAALAYCAGQAGIDFDDVPSRTDSLGRGVVIY